MNMSLKGMLKSLNAKPGQVVSNPYARAFAPLKEAEGQDHEVSMAKGSLEAMIKHCNELMQKLGEGEKDIPGWIQDHIAKAENYIQQANSQYHEYGTEESVNEIAYTSDGNLKIKKQYKNVSDYEKVAKSGDYVWVGNNPNDFKGISKNLLDRKSTRLNSSHT